MSKASELEVVKLVLISGRSGFRGHALNYYIFAFMLLIAKLKISLLKRTHCITLKHLAYLFIEIAQEIFDEVIIGLIGGGNKAIKKNEVFQMNAYREQKKRDKRKRVEGRE